MSEKITHISFALCPYVQRAVIMLNEKGVAFERINIDLANKPEWFLQISPQGKVPVLKVGDEVLFESAAIVEYLDEVYGPRLHPHDPIARARHRAWMEFGSAVLSDNWTIATAKTQEAFDAAVTAVRTKLTRLEGELGKGRGLRANISRWSMPSLPRPSATANCSSSWPSSTSWRVCQGYARGVMRFWRATPS